MLLLFHVPAFVAWLLPNPTVQHEAHGQRGQQAGTGILADNFQGSINHIANRRVADFFNLLGSLLPDLVITRLGLAEFFLRSPQRISGRAHLRVFVNVSRLSILS